MKILILTNHIFEPAILIRNFLQRKGYSVNIITNPLTNYIKDYDLGISIHYRSILTKEEIDSFKYGVINIHPGCLPFGRGSDPVIWSIIDDVPSGITIHWIDEGLDTGNILYQTRVNRQELETGESLYERMMQMYLPFFTVCWNDLECGITNNNIPKGISQKSMETDEGWKYRPRKRKDLEKIGNMFSSWQKTRLIKNMLALTHSEYDNMYLKHAGKSYAVRLTLEEQ